MRYMGKFTDDLYDDFYGRQYAAEKERKDNKYKSIIAEFQGLTLEEKVNKLIERHAFEQAYCD